MKQALSLLLCLGMFGGHSNAADPGGWLDAKWGIGQSQILSLPFLWPYRHEQTSSRMWQYYDVEIEGRRFNVTFVFGPHDDPNRGLQSVVLFPADKSGDPAIGVLRDYLAIHKAHRSYGAPRVRCQSNSNGSQSCTESWELPTTTIVVSVTKTLGRRGEREAISDVFLMYAHRRSSQT